MHCAGGRWLGARHRRLNVDRIKYRETSSALCDKRIRFGPENEPPYHRTLVRPTATLYRYGIRRVGKWYKGRTWDCLTGRRAKQLKKMDRRMKVLRIARANKMRGNRLRKFERFVKDVDLGIVMELYVIQRGKKKKDRKNNGWVWLRAI